MAGEEIFELVVNTADGVFGVDDDQRIVFWNRSAERLLGLPAREVLGRFCDDVLRGRGEENQLHCQRNCAIIRGARSGRSVATRDIHARPPGGRELWLNVSTILVPSRWKHLSVLIHVFRPIDRQKEIERSVMELLGRLERWSAPPHETEVLDHDPPAAALDLTQREMEILGLLASGASTEHIVEALSISPSTVRNHVQHLLTKLGVHNRLEAVTLGLRNGLVPQKR